MRYKLIAIAIIALASQSALAQIDKYDPNSGKYVTSDPFAPPGSSGPSPYRLNPRVSRNLSLPPAALNPQVPAASVPTGGAPTPAAAAPAAQPLVPMDGMAMYGEDVGATDPFAKPDWWPH